MFRIIRTIAFSSALIACAGCSTSPSSTTDQNALALSQRCTNPQTGVSIAYPAGWFTNRDVLPSCSVFDAKPIELARESEIPFDVAVMIGIEEKPFNANVASSQWERVIAVDQTSVADKRAVRIEAEATGEGLADRGMRSLRYEVDLGNGRTLVATTHDAGGNFEHKKEVLAAMVQTISVR